VGGYEFYANTTIEYGTNLFYEPIPYEMLRTYEETPQLIVTVDDVPAACHNLTCNFTFIEPVGEITYYEYDSNAKKLTIEGVDIPVNETEIQGVTFAQTHCTLVDDTLTATGLECILDEEPTCGTYLPDVTTILGNIPHNEYLEATRIGCSIYSLYPDTDTKYLNALGGDNITISGQYLPKDLSTSDVSIKFSDT